MWTFQFISITWSFIITPGATEGAAGAGEAASKETKSWTNDEQKRLEQALKTYGPSTKERWDRIAEAVPTRTKKECMLRYKVGHAYWKLTRWIFMEILDDSVEDIYLRVILFSKSQSANLSVEWGPFIHWWRWLIKSRPPFRTYVGHGLLMMYWDFLHFLEKYFVRLSGVVKGLTWYWHICDLWEQVSATIVSFSLCSSWNQWWPIYTLIYSTMQPTPNGSQSLTFSYTSYISMSLTHWKYRSRCYHRP